MARDLNLVDLQPPGLGTGTAVLAFVLLAHWWSRPEAEEVITWLDAAEAEASVRASMHGPGGPPPFSSRDWELANLLDEHERLFVGPGPVPCPPYESFWREDVPIDVRRSLMGPCTADLRRLYAELGLEMAPAGGELPDHIAVELEALGYALSSEPGYAQARAIFFEHLRRWLPRLCRAVAHEAQAPFYRDLAEVTLQWMGPLEQHLGQLVDASP